MGRTWKVFWNNGERIDTQRKTSTKSFITALERDQLCVRVWTSEKEKEPSSTKFTVSQHEHLACRVPRGYESSWRQEPQTIWAISASKTEKASKVIVFGH